MPVAEKTFYENPWPITKVFKESIGKIIEVPTKQKYSTL